MNARRKRRSIKWNGTNNSFDMHCKAFAIARALISFYGEFNHCVSGERDYGFFFSFFETAAAAVCVQCFYQFVIGCSDGSTLNRMRFAPTFIKQFMFSILFRILVPTVRFTSDQRHRVRTTVHELPPFAFSSGI